MKTWHWVAGAIAAAGALYLFLKKREHKAAEEMGEKVAEKVLPPETVAPEFQAPQGSSKVVQNGIARLKLGKITSLQFEVLYQFLTSRATDAIFMGKLAEYFKEKAPAEYEKWVKERKKYGRLRWGKKGLKRPAVCRGSCPRLMSAYASLLKSSRIITRESMTRGAKESAVQQAPIEPEAA